MPFRVVLDGANKGPKFATKEEAVEAMWALYEGKMDRAEFDKLIANKVEEV